MLSEESSLEMQPTSVVTQVQLLQHSTSIGSSAAQKAAALLPTIAATPDQQQGLLQPQLAKQSSKLYAADVADIKQKSADLSQRIVSLMQELLFAITEQLQGHSMALLASLLSACAPQVAAAAATPAGIGAHNSAAAIEAAARSAAAELLAGPAAQIVLGPLLREMASLDG
jgi:hypothetical protein